MKITFFGTTTLLFDDGKTRVLFDAHLSRPPFFKVVLGLKAATDKKIIDEQLKSVDSLSAIFISHTHYDHVMDAPYIAQKYGAKIYGSKSSYNVAIGGGVGCENFVLYKDNETYNIGDFKVKVIPSKHSEPNILNKRMQGEIVSPLYQPANLRAYKEGGSYDFYIENGGKSFMIRPSFNYIVGQMDGYKADVLYLGVAGLQRADKQTEEKFFFETIDKLEPKLVIPIHWDNFFSPLNKPIEAMPRRMERTEIVFNKLSKYCERKGVNCVLQLPCSTLKF